MRLRRLAAATQQDTLLRWLISEEIDTEEDGAPSEPVGAVFELIVTGAATVRLVTDGRSSVRIERFR